MEQRPDPVHPAARYVRSTFVMAHLVNPIVARLSGTLVLSVVGRKTGRPARVPLGRPFDLDGVRYLVAGGGETHWVRNLRAAGGGELRLGGERSRFRAVELEGPDRDRIVAAYRTRQGRTVAPFFRALPELRDHPVFRVEPMIDISAEGASGSARAVSAPSLPAAGGPLTRHLSRRERVGLVVQRALDRWLSPFGVWIYRRTKGGIAGPWHKDVLLLTTRGRRSGRSRTVVLQFFRDGEAMILAAANDGGRTNPGWYFNLAADPVASVEVNARRLAVRAEVLPAAEAGEWWPRIVARDPTYVRYASATSRAIPIVRLVPLEPGSARES